MEDKTESVSLPEILSVFPLTGVLLLPGTRLPLHIFEPRYRNLVQDALEAEGVFGMIQPFVPQTDNLPRPAADHAPPNLYDVGCAGHIERWEKSSDGRYMVQLRGISRFRIKGGTVPWNAAIGACDRTTAPSGTFRTRTRGPSTARA